MSTPLIIELRQKTISQCFSLIDSTLPQAYKKESRVHGFIAIHILASMYSICMTELAKSHPTLNQGHLSPRFRNIKFSA